jgi:hypothetical protein
VRGWVGRVCVGRVKVWRVARGKGGVGGRCGLHRLGRFAFGRSAAHHGGTMTRPDEDGPDGSDGGVSVGDGTSPGGDEGVTGPGTNGVSGKGTGDGVSGKDTGRRRAAMTCSGGGPRG